MRLPDIPFTTTYKCPGKCVRDESSTVFFESADPCYVLAPLFSCKTHTARIENDSRPNLVTLPTRRHLGGESRFLRGLKRFAYGVVCNGLPKQLYLHLQT